MRPSAPSRPVTAFDSEDEVVARANDTEYGLVAYVVDRKRRPARCGSPRPRIRYGAVNRVKITGGPIPFGGLETIGPRREGSAMAMEAFTELQYLCIDTACLTWAVSSKTA